MYIWNTSKRTKHSMITKHYEAYPKSICHLATLLQISTSIGTNSSERRAYHHKSRHTYKNKLNSNQSNGKNPS